MSAVTTLRVSSPVYGRPDQPAWSDALSSKMAKQLFRHCTSFPGLLPRANAKQTRDRSCRSGVTASGNHLAFRSDQPWSDDAPRDESHHAEPPENRSRTACQQRSPSATSALPAIPYLRLRCRPKTSMKFVSRQTTLHLSFKINVAPTG